jgi:alpha-L-arabinofuranosidase/PKD repeat protein
VSRFLRSGQRSVASRAHFFRFENRRVVRWSIIIPFVLLLASFCFPSSAQAQADITVDVATSTGKVNPLLLGNNVMFVTNGGMLWDVRTNDLYPSAKPFIQTLAPSVLRFPGGSLSDDYFWEDAIGYKTTIPTGQGATSISLEAMPDWGGVSSGVFLDRTRTEDWWQWGDSFTFTQISGTQLQGVSGVGVDHPAGVEVRPGARLGQPSWVDNQFGIDEHMKLATSQGAQAIITVNYGSGRDQTGALSTAASLDQKVKRAAAWVAYLNGSPSDGRTIGVDPEGHDWKTVGYWAQKRADRGHPAPYGVIYWEIGNEIYGGWETGFTTVRKYAQDFIAFATTMKAIDPSIKVGAVTWSEPHYRGDADTTDEWAATLVTLAGDYIDALVVHLYYPAASQAQVSYTSPTWYTATMAAAQQVVSNLTQLRAVIAVNSSRAGQIEVVVTEYGILPFESPFPRDHSNLAGSLYHADLLIALLQHPELNVTLATAFTMHDANTQQADTHFDWTTNSRWARPQYYALELIRNYLALNLHNTSINSPTFSTAQVGNVAYTTSIPTLGALASTDDTGRLTLLVINRDQSNAITASTNLLGYTPQPTATVRTLTGDSLAAHNEDIHSTVVLTTTTISSAATAFSYTFPAHSLTMIEFQGVITPALVLAPMIISISPSSITAPNGGGTLTVNGANFDISAQVRWNGSSRPTTFVNNTRVTAAIPASDVATAGFATVTVTTTAGTSNELTFTINNPIPTTTSLSPSSTTVGASGFTLTVNGTNFVNGSTVQWGGSNRTTTYVSATQLTALISAGDVASAGTAIVTVLNATPGGGTSGGQTFTINNLTPPTAVITANPNIGKAPLTVTFDGSRSTAAGNATIVRYTWTLGDGSTRTGLGGKYTYTSPGTYTATLSVTDSTGLTGTTSVVMRIKKR